MDAQHHETYTVSLSDCDASGRLRPSSLLIHVQEAGERHAASYGLSRAELVAQGMFWVLYRQRVVMRSYPTFGDALRLTTWPGAVEGPVFPRYFCIERADGTLVCEAVTSWVLVNLQTRRPLRPSMLVTPIPVCARPAPLPLPGMLRLENARAVEKRPVRYSDLDINGHMTNTRYIDWVCDLLDLDALARRGLAEWQVNFIAEAKPGDLLELFLLEEGPETLVQGKRASDGRTVFEARAVLG